ncbi:hypothetical protein [Oceanomicrobium pacificus]|uniref:Uncharacterized protein n=1 Tax=Oceanomicrobium pacificus TaxID=2692916 RepID=A0A6B0TQX1_9RHOB|nr:hypothetical protein [Oceanomicrobium pacificus]MXU66336.1 hypothetical protein [Oceanomicrobium pacificus]
MSLKTFLGLVALAALLAAADIYYQTGVLLFLGKQLARMTSWLAFWR